MQNPLHGYPVALAIFVATALSSTPVAAAPDYSGPYVEVRGGYDRFTSEFDDSDGAVFGVGAGYDVAIENFIVGIGAGIDFASNDYVEVKDFRGSHHYEFEVEPKRDIEITTRVGMRLWDALAYARLGYSNARFGLDHRESAAPFSGSHNFDGLRVGGGLEWQFFEHLHARAEYRFTDYDYNLQRHQVVGTLAYRF